MGKTTRSFRYDLNQILHDYTVEVRNRFKGLDMIRVLDELWMEVHDIVQETGIKTILRKRKAKKQMIVCGGLTNSCEKNRSKKQRRKGKIFPFECRIARRDKKAFLRDQCKEIEENSRMGKTSFVLARWWGRRMCALNFCENSKITTCC